MTKKQVEAQLREAGIHNTHNLLLKFGRLDIGYRDDVAVSYFPGGTGRSVMAASSYVWSPRFKTDPNAAWYDYGRKTFVGRKDESFPLAKQWAEEQFGIKEWVVDPTDRSTLISKEVYTRILEFLNKPTLEEKQ